MNGGVQRVVKIYTTTNSVAEKQESRKVRDRSGEIAADGFARAVRRGLTAAAKAAEDRVVLELGRRETHDYSK